VLTNEMEGKLIEDFDGEGNEMEIIIVIKPLSITLM
jgi:hypothetical protein